MAMSLLIPRLQYLTRLVRLAAVIFLIWRNISHLFKSLTEIEPPYIVSKDSNSFETSLVEPLRKAGSDETKRSRKSDVEGENSINMNVSRQNITAPRRRTYTSIYDSESMRNPVHQTIPDIIDPKEWPPLDMLEHIVSKRFSSSSDVGDDPNAPRIVVAAITYEDVDFADNFANSLLSLKVKNFVLVPLDMKAYQALQEGYPKHTVPVLPGLESLNASSYERERHDNYILAAFRPIVIRYFLKLGFAVFYNDAETVWQHNAWEKIDKLFSSTKKDQNAAHRFPFSESAFWRDESNQLCNCIMYLLPTINSLSIMEQWERGIHSKEWSDDQSTVTALVERLLDPSQWDSMETIKVVPNDDYFPSGKSFSWEATKPENKKAVIIRSNLNLRKIRRRKRLEKAGLWKPSGRMKMTDVSWPPSDFIDSLLANAAIPSSAETIDGIPRVVVAASNRQFVDFADNFANSLLSLNITNFVLVPLDSEAHDTLHAAYPEHTLPILPGLEEHLDGKADFGSAVFKLLTSSRPVFLHSFLRKGYAVFYNDIDIVWQHNAWDFIDELNIKNNLEKVMWQDTDYQVCSCMLYLLPGEDSLLLMEEWEDEINSESHQNDPVAFDQDAFANVLDRRKISRLGGTFDSTKVVVNDAQFPAGKHFYWNKPIPENNKAIIVHNNWIVGKWTKKTRFIQTDLWNPSGRISFGRTVNWPSIEFIDSLLAKSLSSMARTSDGIPRVIVAAVTFEFVDFADNFANSLLALSISNFVLVPLDIKTYEVLHESYPEHTLPIMPGLANHRNGSPEFGSDAHKLLASSLPFIILSFLQHGYAVFYNDVDTVWQQNAWHFLDKQNRNKMFDQILWQDTDYQICTCMLYVLPTKDSIFLIEEWEDVIHIELRNKNSVSSDQDSFAEVAARRQILSEGGVFGRTNVIVNDEHFPAGKHYSWSQKIPDNEKAIIVHNNWIVGKRAMKDRFMTAGLWNPSGRVESPEWPSSKFIDSLLANAAVLSSTQTKEGFRRVVVAACNGELVDFADNFANSLLSLSITNFLFVPLDRKAFEILNEAYPEHTLPILPELEFSVENAHYGTKEFKLLTSSRPFFLRPILEKGYAVLYNDIDMVWQQNAWDIIDERDSLDTSHASLDAILWKDGHYQICTCMMYLKPSPENISLLQEWENEINTNSFANHDQDAFAKVAANREIPHFGGVKDKTRVYTNDLQFPSGQDYSWDKVTPDNKKAVIVHNNYIVGSDDKRTRFATAGLWNPSGRLPTPVG
jgi:rhamnogalacturonan II specific xylosyltransferase